MSTPGGFEWASGKRVQRCAMTFGCAGLVCCSAGAFFDPPQFFHAYLTAFTATAAIALGSLALWMIHSLTGGAWGFVLRRFFEAATRTLPLLALAYLPMAFALPDMYSWASPEGHPEQSGRAQYLAPPFFLARTAVYFAAWLVLASLLQRWSAEQDRTADLRPAECMQALAGPGLVIYGLTMTFASVDWIMSLDPSWSSTIFGALVATGQMLPALGLAIAMASWFATDPRLATVATPDVWQDLGNLLLTFVMLWTYMMYAQLLLIWSGNLPEEITWYYTRAAGGWQWVGVLLAVGYFALPFFLLLSRDIKRNPNQLRIVALAIVAMSLVQHFWLIAPVYSPRWLYVHWMDGAALVGVGGLWFAYFLHQLQLRPLVPIHAPAGERAPSHA